jgi:hypothetical protein
MFLMMIETYNITYVSLIIGYPTNLEYTDSHATHEECEPLRDIIPSDAHNRAPTKR